MTQNQDAASQKSEGDVSTKIALEASVLLLVLLAITGGTHGLSGSFYNGVEDLVSEPGFRSLKLKWRYSQQENPRPPIGFIIKLCEQIPRQRWEDVECFERHLLLGRGNSLGGYDTLESDGRGRFEATLQGLRMLTNYSVDVEAMEDHNRVDSFPVVPSDGRRENLRLKDHQMVVKTKGFSAHATNCLANSSDIVVSSGPYFGGKIAVEGSADPRCSVFGNRSSPQDTYTLKIDHRLCGSKTVNDSRIDTVVVVHESSSVVTHNSRRFLVQCAFLPETFTIKAAFSVPKQESEASKKNFQYRQLEEALKHADSSSNDLFTYDQYKGLNHVKDSRMSSEQGRSSVVQGQVPGYESQMLSLLVVVIVLIIVIIMVIGFSLWCYIHAHRRRSESADIDTLSTSGSSFMAYHIGQDGDALVRAGANSPMPYSDALYGHTFPRPINNFLGNQVALVSLKPVKELY
ncbi:hypothetical protein JTE90_008126 [Oedothorax gibbosus]|uniref:ZP domain-containing protein n=1 Tax=Oedothorax gibbosus TaxID=931172 RepID=A0AAV6TXL0_9ARAC|nr:hypothetical protein JTE90_008126 [Oedothorax gibbosus]